MKHLFLCLAAAFVLVTSTNANASSYELVVCDGCSTNQMQTAAMSKATNGSINVQVSNPSDGRVLGFVVEKESEPGFSFTYALRTAANDDVIAATNSAKKMIDSAKTITPRDESIVDIIKNRYPSNLPSHVKVIHLPNDYPYTAPGFYKNTHAEIDLWAIGASQFNIPITDKILKSILGSIAYTIIFVYPDGTILPMKHINGSIPIEPLIAGMYLDADGHARNIDGAYFIGTTGAGERGTESLGQDAQQCIIDVKSCWSVCTGGGCNHWCEDISKTCK